MDLSKFCKAPTTSAYDVLQNEIGYFESDARVDRKAAPRAAVPTKKEKTLVYNNIPQTPEKLVARLYADMARVDKITDQIGKEITLEAIAKLSAFLVANNIAF